MRIASNLITIHWRTFQIKWEILANKLQLHLIQEATNIVQMEADTQWCHLKLLLSLRSTTILISHLNRLLQLWKLQMKENLFLFQSLRILIRLHQNLIRLFKQLLKIQTLKYPTLKNQALVTAASFFNKIKLTLKRKDFLTMFYIWMISWK